MRKFRKCNFFVVRVDDLIDSLGKAKYNQYLSGYWQIAMDPEDQHKTAFTMPFGCHSVFKGLLFFSTRMMDVYDGRSTSNILGLFFSIWFDLKPIMKCQLSMSECVYLGYVAGGSHAGETGSVEYQSCTEKLKFIQQYASIAAILTDLTITWKSSPNKSIGHQLVRWPSRSCYVCAAPILSSKDFSKPFVLHMHADRCSDRGVGAVFSLMDRGSGTPCGILQPEIVEKYMYATVTVEKECLTVKLGVETFRVYYTWASLHSGNRALPDSRTTCICVLLGGVYSCKQNNDYKVRYRPGTTNGNAEALSRVLSLS